MNTVMQLMNSSRTLVAIISLLTATACAGSEESEPRIYLLPEGYVGAFYIVFNIPSGESQTYEDGARVYDIPEDGVLLMQSDSGAGRIHTGDIKWFYESEDGTREKVEGRWTTTVRDTPESRADEQVYIFGGGINLIKPVKDCEIYAKDFHVGTKAQILDGAGHFDIYSDQGIDNLPDEVFLEACNEGEN